MDEERVEPDSVDEEGEPDHCGDGSSVEISKESFNRHLKRLIEEHGEMLRSLSKR